MDFWNKARTDKPAVAVGDAPASDNAKVETYTNSVYFYTDVTSMSAADFNIALRRCANNSVSAGADHVNVHIHSPGGSVFAGTSMMDVIRQTSRIIPVKTVVEGCAASAATFMSVVGSERLMHKHSYILIHQLSSVFWGKHQDIKDHVENLDRFMTMIRDIYGEHTRVPKSKLDAILKRDMWWDADTCLKYGLVDRII